jgi:hypothetical protein
MKIIKILGEPVDNVLRPRLNEEPTFLGVICSAGHRNPGR